MSRSSLDGEALKLFRRLESCPDAELAKKFASFVRLLGSRKGAHNIVLSQRDKTGRNVSARLISAGLIPT